MIFFYLFKQVVETIQGESKYKIARTLFAGSFGKKTNINASDIDCVYFINDKYPPFDSILAEFYDICKNSSIKEVFNIELNKKSIRFTNDYAEMDLVLATNFVKDPKKHQSVAHLQQKHVLDCIKHNPAELNYKLSGALAEASVYFMKTRVSFANEMARLAKHWFKTVKTTVLDNISGASTFIETLAVYASRKGRRGKRKFNPHLKAFIRFLEAVMKFESLNVAFNRCNAMFRQHPPVENVIPRVIDPVNPYNNLVNYWNIDSINSLKDMARATHTQIQHLILSGNYSDDRMIDLLFKT